MHPLYLMLVIFAGLPGVGKTTVARQLAREIGAVYLRIDTIEQAMRECGETDLGPKGYVVAGALATENLRLGRTVVADSVNPIDLTRVAWHQCATAAGTPYLDVEIICSDGQAHRKRVETRSPDISGHVQPTWEEVEQREYEEWQSDRVTIDTAHGAPEEAVEQIRRAMSSRSQTD